ncbi:IS4 family transposase [Streptomyces sp. NPDC090026]|uniref:IS4 family transposase n=1 Tax=Streptomyces sp. NPDC090026 TaxID=3365923 RepID=UPI00382F4FCF
MPLPLTGFRSTPIRMGRLRPLRLPDVGLGALTRWCPPELVDRAIRKHARQERRRRLLPARTVVYFELARCLFPQEGYASVYEHLLPRDEELDLYLTKRGFRVPNKSSLCKARRRLGPDVMEEVFRQVAGPVANEEDCPTAFWRGLRLEAFDGTVLDVADTPENTAEFTRPAGGAGTGGYPQARVVALAECGTHALIDAAIGGRRQGETTLAMTLAASTGPGTLVLADRNTPGVPLWTAFRRTGAHLLWRLKGPTAQRVEKVLPDGSYLTHMHLDKNLRAAYRRRGEKPPGPVPLRVIEYTVEGSDEIYRLATSLLDPQEAPAHELAALYSQRWESEGIFAEVKTAQRGSRSVLLSNRPDQVRQEIWAHLIVHHLTRDLMHHAATGTTPPLDPDRISFRTAQRLVRRDLSPLLSPL